MYCMCITYIITHHMSIICVLFTGTKVDDKDDNEHFSTAAIVVIVLLILVIAGGVIMFIFLWNRDKFPVCSKYKSKDVITPSTGE